MDNKIETKINHDSVDEKEPISNGFAGNSKDDVSSNLSKNNNEGKQETKKENKSNKNKRRNKKGNKTFGNKRNLSVNLSTGKKIDLTFPFTSSSRTNSAQRITLFSVMKNEFRLFGTGVLLPERLYGWFEKYLSHYLVSSGYSMDNINLSKVTISIFEMLEASYEAYSLLLHLLRRYSCKNIKILNSESSISSAFSCTYNWESRTIPSVIHLDNDSNYDEFNIEKLSMAILNDEIFPLFQNFYLTNDGMKHSEYLFGNYHRLREASSTTIYLDNYPNYGKSFKITLERLQELSEYCDDLFVQNPFLLSIFSNLGLNNLYDYVKKLPFDLSGGTLYLNESEDSPMSNTVYNWPYQWMSFYDDEPLPETGSNPDPEIFGTEAREEITPLSFTGFELQANLVSFGLKVDERVKATKAGDDEHTCMLKIQNFMRDNRSDRFTKTYLDNLVSLSENTQCKDYFINIQSIKNIKSLYNDAFNNTPENSNIGINSSKEDIEKYQDYSSIVSGLNFIPQVAGIVGAAYNSYKFYSDNRSTFRRVGEYAKRAFKTPDRVKEDTSFNPKEGETREEFIDRVKEDYDFEWDVISNQDLSIYSNKYRVPYVNTPIKFTFAQQFSTNLDNFMHADLFRMMRPYCSTSVQVIREKVKFSHQPRQVSIPGFIEPGVTFDTAGEAHSFSFNRYINQIVSFPIMFHGRYWPTSDGSKISSCTPPGIKRSITVMEDFSTYFVRDHQDFRDMIRACIFFSNYDKTLSDRLNKLFKVLNYPVYGD